MNKEILWQDIHRSRIAFIAFFYPFLAWGLFMIWKDYRQLTPGNIFSLTLSLPLFIYLCIALALPKATYITKDGIRVGNSKDDQYTSVRLNPVAFVPWKNIKKIILLNKAVRHSSISALVSFMVVVTKDRKKHWCFLARKKSFITMLSTLHKENLIVPGKPSDLYLEKERRWINWNSPYVDNWIKFSLPWLATISILGLFWPKPYGIGGSYGILWHLAIVIPPLSYLVYLNKFKSKK